ncbi:hypothetical protein JCM10450v2_004260 [Rhodotorula kratochvilovae]
MKLSTSLVSLALLAPLGLALDRHRSPDSLVKRRHLGQVKRDHNAYGSGSDSGAYGAYGDSSGGSGWADSAAPQDGASSAWTSSSAAAGWADAATPTYGAVPYDTANWAPTETAAAGDWGGSVYDSCIQQCKASNTLAAPAETATAEAGANPYAASGNAYAPPAASGSAAAPGAALPPANGTDVIAGPGQVVVAPKKGDLRMVPFNIAAKPGDTVEFVWGAGPHTVTQSSAGSICNATKEAGAFKSGMQNATFKFPVKVKDEKTVFYYCAVAMHCKMGMFGLINGQVSLDGKSSFGGYMKDWAKKSPENQMMWDETVKITADFPDAASWGDNLSTNQFEDWALPLAMESTLMTRQYFALNAKSLASANTSSSAASPSSPIATAASGDASSPDPSATSSPQADGQTAVAPRTLNVSVVALVLGALFVGLAQVC